MNYFKQETERLLFRKFDKNDVEGWTDFFENNSGLKYLGIDLNKDNSVLAIEWIAKQLERYKDEGLGHLVAISKKTGEFVGVGGILPRIIQGKAEYEIAYSIKPKFWGMGYATEIAQEMKSFGMNHHISNRFISIIHKENAASIRVAQKNGMSILYEMEYLGMNVFVFGIDN